MQAKPSQNIFYLIVILFCSLIYACSDNGSISCRDTRHYLLRDSLRNKLPYHLGQLVKFKFTTNGSQTSTLAYQVVDTSSYFFTPEFFNGDGYCVGPFCEGKSYTLQSGNRIIQIGFTVDNKQIIESSEYANARFFVAIDGFKGTEDPRLFPFLKDSTVTYNLNGNYNNGMQLSWNGIKGVTKLLNKNNQEQWELVP